MKKAIRAAARGGAAVTRAAAAAARVVGGELVTIGLGASLVVFAVGLWMIWAPLAFVVPGGAMFGLIAWGARGTANSREPTAKRRRDSV